MSLPYLNSYNDPKKQKAYLRYMEGKSQREIAEKLKIPARTVAHWSKADSWEEERKSRKIAGETPNVAAVAAEVSAPLQGAATEPSKPQADDPSESRLTRMERMLARQQRMAGLLVGALEIDIQQTFAAAEAAGKTPTRAQIAQLTTLSNNLLTMERKAWCVPDKIQTEDTTPRPEDKVRKLTDEELDRRIAEAAGGTAAPARGEGSKESVN